MATPVQSVSKAATASAVSSVAQAYTTANLSAGNTMVALVVTSTQTGTTTTVSTVKDAALNSFTLVGRESAGSPNVLVDVSLWILATPAGDVGIKPTITATLGSGTANMAILLEELPGVWVVDGTLGKLGGSGSSGSTGSPTYVSSASGEQLIACWGDDGGPLTWTKPAALTSDAASLNTQSFAGIALAYGSSTGGTEAGSWSFTGSTSTEWGVLLVALKLAASGVTGQVQPTATRPVPRRAIQRARVGAAGLCAAGLLGGMAPAGHAPPVTGVHTAPGRGPSRAHAGPRGLPGAGIRGPANATITFVAVGPPAWKPQPRRPPGARAVTRGKAGLVNHAAVRAPKQLTQPRRPPPARALWRGITGTVPPGVAVRAPKQVTQPRRPPGARALWRGVLVGLPSPVITTTVLPGATQGSGYSTTLAAASGTPPYTWSVSSGSLPSGLSLASSTGIISGTPAVTGTVSFTVTVTDSAARTATRPLSITVAAAGAFPLSPLGATVELDLAGTWTDISNYVAYKKALLQIGRGHPDESTNTNPSSMAAVLDNIDKRFTSKNPLGAYYGLIGRNTPVRVSIPEAAPYLRIEGDNTSYAQAPDTSGLSITGDMDVQLDVTLDNWRADQILAAKWAETGNERSWVFYLQGGVLHFGFSTNGTGVDSTNSSEFGGAGSVPVPPLRRQGLRVTFASSTGTVKFYTSPSPLSSAVWTQLGDTSAFGSASIFNGTAPVQVGYCSDAASVGVLGIYGQVHELIILSGIGGTVKGDANFALATAGASSYTDAQGNVWTCEGTAEISARKYRFHGEASSWTPYSEGTTGLDLWCGLDAGGLLRRIQQNTQTLGSAFTRALPSAIALVGYWPCEDGNSTSSGATPATPTQFASAIPTNPAGTFAFGPPQFASDSSFLCSQSLPVINGSRWRFRLPARSADTANVYRFLLSMPATSDTNGGVIARMYTAGTIQRLDLVYSTGGGLTLNGYDATPTLLFTIGPDAFGTDGTPMWCSLELQTSGSSVQYSVVTLTPGAATGFAMTGTLSSASIGNATLIDVNETGALQGTAVGQVTYQSEWESLYDFATQLDAYQGETAGNRFARLCAEEGIPFRSVGSLDDTVVMGAQTPVAFSALLQECVDADTGQMFEPRQALALGYRTRRSLENQGAGIALDYSLDGYAGFLTPTEDDQYTKNDVTATRAYAAGGGTGSSSEAVISEGPLSVQPPPDGVGPYLDSVTVNVDLDAQLQDIASWHAWLGSVDQPRYPAIPYDLARTDIGANLYAVPDLDLGDRLTIGNPPAWEPPDGISQLVQQITETIGELSYSIAWTGVPEQPYELAIADDPVYGRADSPDSTLHTGITSSAASMSVAAGASGELWSTSSAPFDIELGGERITVTAVSGSSSPQTFTITRSVNGVVKAQTAGESVSLFNPAIAAL